MTRRLRWLPALCVLVSQSLAAQDAAGWPLHGHDLGGQRFSPLADIDTANVARLAPAWTYHSGVTATFQATPIVMDTVMYLSLPFSSVVALDARTGRERWRYTHRPRTAKLCCGPANRGVAVAGGTVYVGTTDGRLRRARRARPARCGGTSTVAEYGGTTESTGSSGRTIRCRASARPARPASASARRRWSTTARCSSASPAWATDSIPTRGSRSSACRGQYGRPGLMAAFDAETGAPGVAVGRDRDRGGKGGFRRAPRRRRARSRAIHAARSAPTPPGMPTRGSTAAARSTPRRSWTAERHLLIFGTGNPSPQMADASRPGDNLLHQLARRARPPDRQARVALPRAVRQLRNRPAVVAVLRAEVTHDDPSDRRLLHRRRRGHAPQRGAGRPELRQRSPYGRPSPRRHAGGPEVRQQCRARALQPSPQWHRTALFITYDEWGGFFDHVRPPVLPDDVRRAWT